MNLKNIFTTALGCFAVLAACGNDNDSDVTPTPDQPTEEAKDVTIYVTNTSRTYDLKSLDWPSAPEATCHLLP